MKQKLVNVREYYHYMHVSERTYCRVLGGNATNKLSSGFDTRFMGNIRQAELQLVASQSYNT
jgi:hypothetical protein